LAKHFGVSSGHISMIQHGHLRQPR
jgi:hypothetical protein